MLMMTSRYSTIYLTLCCLSINLFQPFTTVKRINELHRWEPFYIGTNEDPLFSEKLTWEGLQDKMTQVSLYQLLQLFIFTNVS